MLTAADIWEEAMQQFKVLTYLYAITAVLVLLLLLQTFYGVLSACRCCRRFRLRNGDTPAAAAAGPREDEGERHEMLPMQRAERYI